MLILHWRSLAFVAVMAVCGSPSIFAQTTAQFPMQFDFTSPGARSLAMGGAFVASADDASAAFINPAGLVFFGKLEASGELRYGTRETSFLAGGRVSGQITGRGLDTIPGPVYSHDDDSQTGLAFLSMMVPIGSNFVLTGYRNEVARVDNSFFSQGAFFRSTFGGITDDRSRELPIDGRRQVSITNWGAALGVKINDTFAVGGGASLYNFDLEAGFARHGVLTDTFSPPDLSLVSSTATQESDDVALSFNGGVLWRPHPTLHAGASFRRGPSFDFVQHDQVFDSGFDLTRRGQFKVPDVVSAGVKWIPLQSERLRVLMDYSHVYYGQLHEDFIRFQALASSRPDQLHIDDGNEFRAGAEYQLGDKHIVIPRVGLWRDPDHIVRYVSTPEHDTTDLFYEATLPGGEAVVHFTFGVGIVWSELFEVHVGSDLSSRSKLVTASFVARFKRTGVAPTPRAP
jgi:long-chain fatty acid transport protein